jgi:hypothetical protein
MESERVKQIIIAISMLSVGLALIIGVVIPIFERGESAGDNAVLKGQSVISRVGQLIN